MDACSNYYFLKSLTFIQSFFFCNYFYGICAVALAIESNLQQRIPLNNSIFYLLLFTGTVWFYTQAYVAATYTPSNNKRSMWYFQHRRWVQTSQRLWLSILLVGAVGLAYRYGHQLAVLSIWEWLLLLAFPLVGIMYYGFVGQRLNLRNIGWLKPFWIGFTWAGTVNVYPIIYYHITTGNSTPIDFFSVVLFFKNFMFVTVLCILFDIKDYADDYNKKLKTFVVKKGLRFTLFYIVIPLSIAGLGSFLAYSFTHHFSAGRIVVNTIPFIAIIAVTYSMQQRKPMLFYLFLIDGLMLLKAICGSIGILYFS